MRDSDNDRICFVSRSLRSTQSNEDVFKVERVRVVLVNSSIR